MSRLLEILHYVLLTVLLGVSASAWSQDHVFGDSFEAIVPASDALAARFLTQATFGPSKADIASVRTIGIDAWITAQMAQPTTLTRPYLQGLNTQGLAIAQGQRLDRWFHTAATAPDQLRQRVAFALSQIMVISDGADNLTNDWQGIAEYQDFMAEGAFGTYRELLEKVALSPQMGKYLSHWRNRKSTATTQPDENFAREIMQLFSIGLIWRNADYTPMLDSNGLPIPTYNQAVISELAQVFTGLAIRCPNPLGLCNPYSSLTAVSDGIEPMVCFPLYHDTSAKQLFDLNPGPSVNAVVLPAGPTCDPEPTDGSVLESQCHAYCSSDLDAALDAIASHPNVAPFISFQLIQRLVTSNPSPAYVARVSTAFTNSGGNLGVTVRTLLEDPDARSFDPAAPNFGQPLSAGKLREPLLRVTAIWRAFGAQPGLCSGSCLDQSNPPGGLTEQRMGLRSPEMAFVQRPLGASSVFNFYAPNYQQSGAIADAGLFSPEFQILDETTSVTAANTLWGLVWSGYDSGTGAFSLPNRNAYFPVAQIDSLPTDAGALLDELNLRLMYGSMSGSYVVDNCAAGTGMKGTLYKLLKCAMSGADNRRKVLGAVHLIAISPEFSVQR